MKITTDKNNLIIKIPLWQNSYDAIGQDIGKVSNVIGCIEGEKFGFIQVIDLGYKDSFDFGDFIIELSDKMELDVFKKICEDNNIHIYEYPSCSYCGNVICGSFTFGKNGRMCYKCEWEKEGRTKKKLKKFLNRLVRLINLK